MARSIPASAQYQPEVTGCGATTGKAKAPPSRSRQAGHQSHTPGQLRRSALIRAYAAMAGSLAGHVTLRGCR